MISIHLLRGIGAIRHGRCVAAHDAAGAAGGAAVAVARAGGGADADGFHVCAERCIGQVSVPAGPVDGADRCVCVAGVPETEMHLHGGLWVLIVAGRVTVVSQYAYDATVDGPGELGGGPIERVGVEARLGGEGCGDLDATVVVAGHAFAEVVCLDDAAGSGVEVCAREFLEG